jgi:hypothetical protein
MEKRPTEKVRFFSKEESEEVSRCNLAVRLPHPAATRLDLLLRSLGAGYTGPRRLAALVLHSATKVRENKCTRILLL